MTHFDVLVLGAGPGGYVAAIRAAQLGKSVAVVEHKYWGGVCLNVGCIPSKALIKSAELSHLITARKAELGLRGHMSVDFGVTHSRSRKAAATSARGVHFLMRKNKIAEIDGWGRLTSPTSVAVTKNGESSSYTCDDLIIAVGAQPRLIPGSQRSRRVVTYEEQILDDGLPTSMIIAGSGAIGVEFAYVLSTFGVEVTIVEFLDRMVPTEDADVSKELLRQYRKLGVNVMLSTTVTDVEDSGDRVSVTVFHDGKQQVLEADKLLQAIGFQPRTEGYGLQETGVTLTERGAIAVDGRGRTNVEHVYAIGDVTGKMMLAHAAEAMGVVAAETIADAETLEIDFDMIPRATFCQPQIGSFGYTEQQAKDLGYDVQTATFPFSANGKARASGEGVGFVKLVADAKHNELLGAHMIGPDVTEQLPALTLAQRWDLTADELSRNIIAHPTLSEAVKEALHGITGHMINL